MVLNVILKWGMAFKSERTFESFSGIYVDMCVCVCRLCVCVCVCRFVYIHTYTSNVYTYAHYIHFNLLTKKINQIETWKSGILF